MKSGLFGRTGARRLQMALLRRAMAQAARSGSDTVQTGVIRKEEGEAEHWAVNEDGDLMVSVTLDQHQVPIWALFAPLAGGTDLGVWVIPAEGTEVVVGFPDGDVSGDPVVLVCLGHSPADLTAARVLVMSKAGGEVWIYDGSGTPEPVVKRSEFIGHTHSYTDDGTPMTTGGAASITGTQVLKAK